MKACIRGAGVVGGFGCGLSRLEEAIRKRPAPDSDPEVTAMAAFTARTDLLDRLIPPKTLRRVDHYARMAILASHLAAGDAGMGKGLPENTGLVVATGMGPTANKLDLQPADVAATDLALSPILFSNSVHNAAAAYISMLLKVQGPSLSINQYEMAVPLAFQTAIDWLEEGRTETVLVGSIDCFSKALHEASLSCRNLKTGDSGQAASSGRRRKCVFHSHPDRGARASATLLSSRSIWEGGVARMGHASRTYRFFVTPLARQLLHGSAPRACEFRTPLRVLPLPAWAWTLPRR